MTSPTENNLRLIVIDDEPSWCAMLANSVRLLGATLDIAHSFDTAKPLLQAADAEQRPYAIAIIDMNFKVGKYSYNQGIEVIQYIKSQHPHTRCVVASGEKPLPDSVLDLRDDYDLDYYLQKDRIDLAKIRKAIERAMRRTLIAGSVVGAPAPQSELQRSSNGPQVPRLAHPVAPHRPSQREYLDFEIRFSALDEIRYAIAARGPGGDADSTITLPYDDPAFQSLAEQLAEFDADETQLAAFGQQLFNLLFREKIKDIYYRSQGMLSEQQRLRLRLTIPPTELAISAIPWEFLHDPDIGPLAMFDIPIMRYIPLSAQLLDLAIRPPLKMLLTGAQTPPLSDVEREIREIATALSDMNDLIQVTIEPHINRSKLQQFLRQGFHIWHFVGHGGYQRDGTTGMLMFEDFTGDSDPISAAELGVLLGQSGIRLIMLNACLTGRLATGPFTSVALALVRAQIPAVIAMQHTVATDVARAFAREFYQALGERLPIDVCITEGRKAIMHVTGLQQPDWGIPVVYTRALNGRLFSHQR